MPVYFIKKVISYTRRRTLRGCEKKMDSKNEIKNDKSHSNAFVFPNPPPNSTVAQNATATVQNARPYPTYIA